MAVRDAIGLVRTRYELTFTNGRETYLVGFAYRKTRATMKNLAHPRLAAMLALSGTTLDAPGVGMPSGKGDGFGYQFGEWRLGWSGYTELMRDQEGHRARLATI